MPPDAVYAFKHALVQDVAYSTLLRGARRTLHARIAQALQQNLPETAEAQPELLARHFAEAGLTEEAVRHWRLAGERSLARSATAEAAVQFGAAIHLLDDIPDSPERRTQSIDLHLSLGQALRAAKGIASPETTESFRIAYDLSIAQGDSERLPQALYGLLLSHFNRAELRIAERLAIDLQTFARGARDIGTLVRGYEIRGMALFGLGELDEARREFEVAISAVDTGSGEATELPATVSRDPNAFVYLALTLFALGYPDLAQARLRQGLAIAAAAPPVVAGFTLNNACYLHLLEGDWQAAKDRAEATMSWATEKGIPQLALYGQLFLGCALAELGRSEEGVAMTADFVVRVRGEVWLLLEMPYMLGLIARVHLRDGQPAVALESLDEALSMIEQTQERWFEAELHRLRGECALLAGTAHAADRAEECFRRALAVARVQGARMWELRAATSLGRVWRRHGRHAEARALLAPIFGRFTEGFETRDLREAKALLAMLS